MICRLLFQFFSEIAQLPGYVGIADLLGHAPA